MQATMDDRQLVTLARKGDQDAFTRLVERHQKMVYNLALGKTGSHHDAEEVTQTAFFKAWQGLPSFQGKAAFSSWLYRLTVNAAIDLLRQRKKHQGALSLDDPDLPVVPDRGPSPEELSEEHERRQLLWQAIESLPEPHRIPLLLREIEGLSYREIAQALDLEEGTVKSRLDGALSLKEETQLHAHLAQCPHCRQLAQELEDLQTQMTSLWVEPPDSLKDALASQDWSKSASSSPPRSPTASPSKRRHLLPWLACAAAAVVLVVGLCQLLLPGGADGLLPKAVIEVFQRPEQDPAAGSEESDPAAPDNPDSPQDPSKDTEQQAEQNGGDAQGEAPSPSDRPTAPNDTEDPQSPPNNNQTPNNPSNPSGDPAPEDPGTDTPPDNNAGDKPDYPPAPAVSRQEAQSLLTAYLAQQGRTLTLVPLDSSPNQGYWRFSGRDANGNAVTFLMVSCSTGQIHEIPVPPSSTGPGLG